MEEGRTEACRSHDGVFRQYKRRRKTEKGRKKRGTRDEK
jgi:hypothetical protein